MHNGNEGKYCGERSPGTHCVGGREGTRSRIDAGNRIQPVQSYGQPNCNWSNKEPFAAQSFITAILLSLLSVLLLSSNTSTLFFLTLNNTFDSGGIIIMVIAIQTF
jgi:hypothetical protein